MKFHVAFCAVAAAVVSASFPAAAESCARVEIHNLRPAQGPLMLAAYDGVSSFRKTAITVLQLQPATETVLAQVCGLDGPEVALMLYQDLNRNGKLDNNAFGIPGEPWATSGKHSAFRAPTWQAAHVPVDGSLIVVTLTP